jgi:hypothetical protein
MRRQIYNTGESSSRWTLDKNEKLTACVATLLVALVFLRACPAGGQATPSDPSDGAGATAGDEDPVPLAEGEAAPFDGDLWPVMRSIRMAMRAEACAERAELELRHEARKFEIELKFERDTAKASRDADQERIRVLTVALEGANPWYRSPAFVATVAVVATLTAVLTAVAVIEAALVPFAQMANP